MSIRTKLLVLMISCLFTGQIFGQAGTWTAVTRKAPHQNNGVCLQMSDGRVMCHTTDGGTMGDGTIWDVLTPDSTGSYINGTWTSTAGMTQERFSFSSAVLKDGRVYAAGGEYGTDGTQAGYHGEVYNPLTNTWTEIAGSAKANVISDGSCKILDNGNILQALVNVSFPVDNIFFNPTTNAYTTAPSTSLNSATAAKDSFGTNESMWLKLPDNSILFVDEDLQTSERYIPSLNKFVRDGTLPVALYDPYGYECGPAWMLPNGKAFFIGGTNKTAIYTPSGTTAPGTWAAGPDVPNGYGMPDAPGVMMATGNILFACSPQPTQSTEFATPTAFYEYNYLTNTFVSVPVPSSAATNAVCQNYCMLGLPNGQVIAGLAQGTAAENEQYYIYTPVGTPVASGKPVIAAVDRLTCTTAMVTGHGFNGISEGSAFGDENECDSNYPLFRFTQNGKVYYARSYNWNSTGVQRGLLPDTAYITLPASMTAGSYWMYCVANGIASDSILFVDSTASLSSSLTPSVCSGSPFTYVPTSTTPGATYTWTRAAVTGISNAAITTPQTTNPNETLVNTTSSPVTVTYAYTVTGAGCTNDQNVLVSVNPPPIPSFTAQPTSGCSVPDSVTFTNTTIAGSTYVWSFGDATTSTAVSPVHPYAAAGTYSVKLVATSACGTDSVTQANYISIVPPAAPVATSPVNISCGGTATLTATATQTDSLKWFSQPSGGTVLATGTTFVTPALHSNTTYYVANYSSSTPSYCPPLTDAFGTGGNYTNDNFRSDVFNVNAPCTLVSVLVVSGAAGNRTIQLTDSTGVNVLQSLTVNIPSGTSTVTLNFPLTVGTGYQLGCGDNATTTNLYRNTAGAAFPYSDPSGFVTITGNNITPPNTAYYYFFYDWKLEGPSCVSARTPVAVNITNGLALVPSITEVACNGGSNGSATITTSGGTPVYTYSWSNGQTTSTLTGVIAGNYTVSVHDAGGCSATASETVSQPAALNVSVTATGASCGGSTGSASATVTGGTSGYSYLWSNSSTGATASNLAPANYTLTVTDAHSCTATAATSVASSGGLNLSSSAVNVACNGGTTGSATVTVTGGSGTITYHWSNGGTTAAINNIAAGNYTVTVSESGACSGTSSQTVSQPVSALSISASAVNTGCGSPNGSVTANASGGTIAYSYLWNNAATTATISNLSAATYNVTVTDNNHCTATTSAVVGNSGSLNISAVPSASNCSGASTGGASAVINGGTAPFTYHWSNGATIATISGVTAATYTVTVSDNTGCSGTASVVITTGSTLSVSASSTSLNCFNAGNGSASVTVTTGTQPYSYIWNNGSTAATISNLTAGDYYVTVTDGSSCVSIDTVTVSQPGAITIFVSPVQPSCSGLGDGSATVSATGGTPSYSYNWSTNTSGTSVSSLAPGSYSVTLTDANSCTSVATFNITNPVPVSAAIVSNNDSCYGASDGNIVVTPAGGTAPYAYVWNNNITAPADNNLAAGTYTVTITDSRNCSDTISATITEPTQIVVPTSTTDATTGHANGSASIGTISGGNAPYTVAWSNGQTTNSITGLAAGTYTVTVTDNKGCETIAHAIVNITEVGITTVNTDLSFKLYPNPASSEVTIDAGTLDKQTTLVLEDILGQSLMEKEVTTTPVTIDVTNYTDGVYFIELRQDGKRAVQKFVISR